MMTENDQIYIEKLLSKKNFSGTFLELGAGYGGETCRDMIECRDFKYYATDMFDSKGVDFVADFTSVDSVKRAFGDIKFDNVMILNVLEHTFDPLSIVDNCRSLLNPGGKLIIITPAIWTLHNYPIDCIRLLPDWYVQYAKGREFDLMWDCFDYVGYGPVANFKYENGDLMFPGPSAGNLAKYWWSRIIQKLFNTYGRSMSFPSHVAIGAVLLKK